MCRMYRAYCFCTSRSVLLALEYQKRLVQLRTIYWYSGCNRFATGSCVEVSCDGQLLSAGVRI